MAKVIRVFGKADSYDIEFTPNGGEWIVDVPPDMTDGVYAVQLTAIDINAVHAYSVGELYMVKGICCFRIQETPYRAYFKVREYETTLRNLKHNITYKPSEYIVDFKKRYSIRTKKKEHKESMYRIEFDTRLRASDVVSHFSLKVKVREILVRPKTDLYTEYTPNTKIFIRKGCSHYGGK